MNSEPQPAAFMMMQFPSKCSSFSRLFLPFLRGFLSAEVLWGNQCQFSSSIFPFCQIPSAPKTSSMIMIVFNFQWLVSSNFKVLTWLLSLLPFALSSNNGSRINSFFFCILSCINMSYLLCASFLSACIAWKITEHLAYFWLEGFLRFMFVPFLFSLKPLFSDSFQWMILVT